MTNDQRGKQYSDTQLRQMADEFLHEYLPWGIDDDDHDLLLGLLEAAREHLARRVGRGSFSLQPRQSDGG